MLMLAKIDNEPQVVCKMTHTNSSTVALQFYMYDFTFTNAGNVAVLNNVVITKADLDLYKTSKKLVVKHTTQNTLEFSIVNNKVSVQYKHENGSELYEMDIKNRTFLDEPNLISK